MNHEMFFVKAHMERVADLAAVDRNENETDTYSLHCIKFQFLYYGIEVMACSFQFVLHFLEQYTKNKGKTWRSS